MIIIKCYPQFKIVSSTNSYLDSAIFAARLQPQYAESSRDYHTFFTIVWGRNTFKKLEAIKSRSPSSGLVGNHSTDRFKENLGGCTVVEGARFLWVYNMALVKEVVVAQL